MMSSIAYDMMTYYHGNETGGTPGLLPGMFISFKELLGRLY